VLRIVILLITVLACLSCSIKKQTPDCSRFRTGNFKYRGHKDEQFLIERNDSMHIETDNNTGITMKLRVQWFEPCVYELQFLSYVMSGKNTTGGTEKPKFPPIRSRIIETAENYYISLSMMEGEKNESRDTIWKIE